MKKYILATVAMSGVVVTVLWIEVLLFGQFSPVQLLFITTLLLVLAPGIFLLWVVRKGFDDKLDNRFGHLFMDNPIPMWIYDRTSLKFLEANDAALATYGYTREELLQRNLLAIRPAADREALVDYFDKELKPYEHGDIWRHRTKKGELKYVTIYAHDIIFKGRSARFASVLDITTTVDTKERYKKQRKFLAQILESLNELIWVVDRSLCLVDANAKFTSGIRRVFCTYLEPGDSVLFNALEDEKDFWENMYQQALSGDTLQFEYRVKAVDHDIVLRISMAPIIEKGKVEQVVCAATDVTRFALLRTEKEQLLQRFKVILEATNEAFWEFDIDAGVVKWSSGLYRSFGYEEAVYPIVWWEEKVHPDDRGRILTSLDRCIQQGHDTWREQYRWRHINGDYHHVIDQGFLMKHPEGGPRQMVGTLQNVEDVFSKEKEIRKLSLVASHTSYGVIITNAHQEIEWVNDGFCHLTGYTMDEVRGLRPGPLLQGKDTDQETKKAIRKALLIGQTITTQILNYNKAGQPYWVELTITPVTEDGNIVQFVAIQKDITIRKQQEAQILNQNIKLQDIAFLSAHGIRLHLSNILGLGKLLEYQKNETIVSEIIPKIIQSCEALDDNIKTLVNQAYLATYDDQEK